MTQHVTTHGYVLAFWTQPYQGACALVLHFSGWSNRCVSAPPKTCSFSALSSETSAISAGCCVTDPTAVISQEPAAFLRQWSWFDFGHKMCRLGSFGSIKHYCTRLETLPNWANIIVHHCSAY